MPFLFLLSDAASYNRGIEGPKRIRARVKGCSSGSEGPLTAARRPFTYGAASVAGTRAGFCPCGPARPDTVLAAAWKSV